MILINKAYMKVWKVFKKDKYVDANCSTGDKQQDGTYKNSSWNVRFIGKAKDKADTLNEGDRIEVTSAKIESIYDKEANKNWVRVIVFDFIANDAEEDLPF